MGNKNGSWFSAIKRAFTPNSIERPVDGSEKNSTKDKKKRGILKHGEAKSLIPLFREPSSIKKILGEVDQQNFLIRPPTPVEQPRPSPLVLPRAASRSVASLRAASPQVTSPKAASLRVASPRAASSRPLQHHKEISLTLRYHNVLATKIQAAYRGKTEKVVKKTTENKNESCPYWISLSHLTSSTMGEFWCFRLH